MEQVMVSSIAPYFTRLAIYEKYKDPFVELPDLATFPFRKKAQVEAYLRRHVSFNEKEYKEFLSFSLERIIITASDDYHEAWDFLHEFGDLMTDTLVNRAVLNAFCTTNIEFSENVGNIFKMLKNLAIVPGSLEAFELFAHKLSKRFSPDLVHSITGTVSAIEEAEIVSKKLGLEIAQFKNFFQHTAKKYEAVNRCANAKIIREFVKKL